MTRPRPGRPRRGEASASSKIIDASKKLFCRKGFSGTSILDIAHAARVTRATIYDNFDDKQDILTTIAGEYLTGYSGVIKRLRQRASSCRTSFDLIQETIRETLAWRVANADLRPLVAVARNLHGTGWDEATAAADDVVRGWILVIHAINEEAGVIRDDIDLDLGVRAAYAMIEFGFSKFDDSYSEREIAPVAEQLALLHWYAICTVPPGEAPPNPLGGNSPF